MKLTIAEATRFQNAAKVVSDFVRKLKETSLSKVIQADDLKNMIEASAAIDHMSQKIGNEEVAPTKQEPL